MIILILIYNLYLFVKNYDAPEKQVKISGSVIFNVISYQNVKNSVIFMTKNLNRGLYGANGFFIT